MSIYYYIDQIDSITFFWDPMNENDKFYYFRSKNSVTICEYNNVQLELNSRLFKQPIYNGPKVMNDLVMNDLVLEVDKLSVTLCTLSEAIDLGFDPSHLTPK